MQERLRSRTWTLPLRQGVLLAEATSTLGSSCRSERFPWSSLLCRLQTVLVYLDIQFPLELPAIARGMAGGPSFTIRVPVFLVDASEEALPELADELEEESIGFAHRRGREALPYGCIARVASVWLRRQYPQAADGRFSGYETGRADAADEGAVAADAQPPGRKKMRGRARNSDKLACLPSGLEGSQLMSTLVTAFGVRSPDMRGRSFAAILAMTLGRGVHFGAGRSEKRMPPQNFFFVKEGGREPTCSLLGICIPRLSSERTCGQRAL